MTQGSNLQLGRRTARYAFTGPIDSASAARIAACLNDACIKGADDVVLSLSSPGGHVADGVFLYNHLRALPMPTTIFNTGTIASIALVVFLGAQHRYATPESAFMTHPTTIGPLVTALAWSQLQAHLQSTIADDNRTDAILRSRTTIPDDILSKRRWGDVYMTPSEAVQYGVAHGISQWSIPPGEHCIQI